MALPFLTLAANRIVAGEGVAAWRMADLFVTGPGLIALVVGLALGLLSGREGLRLAGAALGLAGLLWLLSQGASNLIADAGDYARVSPGAGFWCLLVVVSLLAADALSNLASPGVMGGTLIVVGEDFGEGSSVIQERTHAFAMKSTQCLMDPRPNLTSIVNAVETSFELSEASNTPVMMELRIRACHCLLYTSPSPRD